MTVASTKSRQTQTLSILQDAIEKRQVELGRVADTLAKCANSYIFRTGSLKVALVVLGATLASQGAFQKYFSIHPNAVGFVFTVLGIVVASLAGVEAAFKFDARAAELNTLASLCHSTCRSIEAELIRVIIAPNPLRIAKAMTHLEMQESRLSEIQSRASAIGINITLEIREQELKHSLYKNAGENIIVPKASLVPNEEKKPKKKKSPASSNPENSPP